MEHFYNQNYTNYKVCEIDKFHEEKVWNVEYDEVFDLLYIFVAKIRRLEGDLKKTTTQPSPHSHD